jgi:hypothetical protein
VTPEYPVGTDAEIIMARLASLEEQVTRLHTVSALTLDMVSRETTGQLTTAVNHVGAQVQWLIDQLQGLFAIVGNPAFKAQILGSITGGLPSMMEMMTSVTDPGNHGVPGTGQD